MCIIRPTLRDLLPELKCVGNRSQVNTTYAMDNKPSFQIYVIGFVNYGQRYNTAAIFSSRGPEGRPIFCRRSICRTRSGRIRSRCLQFSASRVATPSHRVTVRRDITEIALQVIGLHQRRLVACDAVAPCNPAFRLVPRRYTNVFE